MIRLVSKGEFNTSRGRAYVVEENPMISVGAKALIDGKEFTIKQILWNSHPSEKKVVGIIVS